jgi:hypothetical protein
MGIPVVLDWLVELPLYKYTCDYQIAVAILLRFICPSICLIAVEDLERA